MTKRFAFLCLCALCLLVSSLASGQRSVGADDSPYLIVLGVAQDGGVPQAGSKDHKGWEDPAFERHVVCLAIVDPSAARRWMIDCTPDFKKQLHLLDEVAPVEEIPGLDGIFLSHAHMGHYTGLVHLGLESMGAEGVPVYAMPEMRAFLRDNGPWSQLVKYKNIILEPLEAGAPVLLGSEIRIVPFLVPHRQEFSEVVGFRIIGPHSTVLYISDIDSWDEWEEQGTRIEELIPEVDVAYLDGTFFANGEIPGRDMSAFPHPFITSTMHRLRMLSAEDRRKVRFIHLNHTNPAWIRASEARETIEKSGFQVAEEMERIRL